MSVGASVHGGLQLMVAQTQDHWQEFVLGGKDEKLLDRPLALKVLLINYSNADWSL